MRSLSIRSVVLGAVLLPAASWAQQTTSPPPPAQSPPGTSSPTPTGVQGVTNGIPVPVSESAAPPGVATSAGQSAVQAAPGSQATSAEAVQGISNGVPLSVTVTNPTAAAPSTVTANQGTAGSAPWPTVVYVAGAAAAASNPVPVAVQNFPATQPISGTVTANQGTSPWVVSGTVAQGAAGTAAWKVDGSGVTQPVSNGGTFAVQNTAATPAGTNTIGAVTQAGAPWAVNGTVTANLGTLNGAATAALQSSTQGTVAPGTAATASTLGGMVYNSTVPAPTNGQGLALQSDPAGNLKINNATLPPGSATLAGQTNTAAGTSSATAQGVQGVTGGIPLPAALTVTAQGGVGTVSRLASSAATTNATLVAAGQHHLYKVFVCGTTTTPAYIKFYNTASTPTPGTTAIFFTRPVLPAAANGGLNCASYDESGVGWSFSAGLAYAITTGNADTDATAVAAGAVTQISVEYQ